MQEKAWEQNPGGRGALVSLAALARSHDLLLRLQVRLPLPLPSGPPRLSGDAPVRSQYQYQ